ISLVDRRLHTGVARHAVLGPPVASGPGEGEERAGALVADRGEHAASGRVHLSLPVLLDRRKLTLLLQDDDVPLLARQFCRGDSRRGVVLKGPAVPRGRARVDAMSTGTS